METYPSWGDEYLPFCLYSHRLPCDVLHADVKSAEVMTQRDKNG
jgi:hypothetical protein